MLVDVRKHKNETLDTYSCVGCGRVWKSSAKKVGHTQSTCDKRNK